MIRISEKKLCGKPSQGNEKSKPFFIQFDSKNQGISLILVECYDWKYVKAGFENMLMFITPIITFEEGRASPTTTVFP